MDKTRRLVLYLTASAMTTLDTRMLFAQRRPPPAEPKVMDLVGEVVSSVSRRSALSAEEVAKEESLKGVSLDSIRNALEVLRYQGSIKRIGDGTPELPFRYYVRETGGL